MPVRTLLILGATGLVGQSLLAQALAEPQVERLIAPTRRPLPAHPRLENPIVDFDRLDPDAACWRADAVICALGTTLRDAGSRAAFRKVDYEYPLTIARLARAQGASTYVLASAMGAHPHSRVFYSRTKGELEQALATCGFASLTFVRPGMLGGQRAQKRLAERIALPILRALAPLLPHRYRIVPAASVARTLLQTALRAQPGVQVIESEAIV